MKLSHPCSKIYYFLSLTISLFVVFFSQNSFATKAVLGNFNQPSTGVYFPADGRNWQAVPFVTDKNNTIIKSIAVMVATITTPSKFFIQIRDIDAFGRPANIIGTLNGPTSPVGNALYTGHIPLTANTSYFVVYGVENGGGSHAVYVITGSSADAGEDIYQFGTDVNADGVADLNATCKGGLDNSAQEKVWKCGGVSGYRFFPKIKIFADVVAIPAVSLSTSTIHFGNIAVATTSDQSLTITNSGSSDLNIGALSSDANVFTLVNDTCSGQTIASGNNCTVDIRFSPIAQGAVNGHLSIPSNATSSPNLVALSGIGDAPIAFLSSGHLSFGNQIVGTSSVTQTVTLSDNGGAPLVVMSVNSNNAAFIVSSDTCSGNTVPIAGSCTFDVAFSPASVGAISSTISVVTGAASSPDNISVDGIGLAPLVSLSTSSVHFGNIAVAASSDQSVIVTNAGSSNLNIGALSSDAAVFTLVNDNCSGQTITAGNTCSFDVRFSPISQGAVNGHISIPSNAISSPDLVALSGIGDAPVAFLSSGHLSFGNQIVGISSVTQTVTLSDNGGAPLVVMSVNSNNAAFIVSSDTCSGNTVPIAGSCTFDVAFSPASVGAISSTISVVTGAASSPDNISVDGTGVVNFGISATPGFIDFGSQNVNTSSATQNIILTNQGSTPLNFFSNSVSNQFSIVADSCSGNTINALATCTIGIQFNPTHGGPISSTLIITSNHPDGPHGVFLFGESVGGFHGPIVITSQPIPVNSKLALLITVFLIIMLTFRHKKSFRQENSSLS